MSRSKVLDVSDLEPPEPMTRVVEALCTLSRDEHLIMRHRHEPMPLFGILEEMGFRYAVRPGEFTAVEIVIWHADADVPKDES